MKIDINNKDAEELVRILEKQIEKTSWVIENKSPANEDFLQNRINTMDNIIKQIKQNLGMEVDSDDELSMDGI